MVSHPLCCMCFSMHLMLRQWPFVGNYIGLSTLQNRLVQLTRLPWLAAMSFLIPIGVVFYAAIGGLKATFTTSYFHTVIVYVVCCIFLYKVFIPGNLLGGIDDVRRLCSRPFVKLL